MGERKRIAGKLTYRDEYVTDHLGWRPESGDVSAPDKYQDLVNALV